MTVWEASWLQLASLSQEMDEPERALFALERALHHNPYNKQCVLSIAHIYRSREQYDRALALFRQGVAIDKTDGSAWAMIGQCCLVLDQLENAFAAFQQALGLLQNPRDPHFWYDIGILYEKLESLDHAEAVWRYILRLFPAFERCDEIYFRLGWLSLQQGKYEASAEIFQWLLTHPPPFLSQADIFVHLGHTYELAKDFGRARDAYEHALSCNPKHSKGLLRFGDMLLRHNSSQSSDLSTAEALLLRAVEADPGDAQGWHALGRCRVAQKEPMKAFESLRQALSLEPSNPSIWCSLGVLFSQSNQCADALAAYYRAIQLNPAMSEVWYNLGSLYEACGQIGDAHNAYRKAAELDPSSRQVRVRLGLIAESCGSSKQNGNGGSASSGVSLPSAALSSSASSSGGGAAATVGFSLAAPPPPPPVVSSVSSLGLPSAVAAASGRSSAAALPVLSGFTVPSSSRFIRWGKARELMANGRLPPENPGDRSLLSGGDGASALSGATLGADLNGDAPVDSKGLQAVPRDGSRVGVNVSGGCDLEVCDGEHAVDGVKSEKTSAPQDKTAPGQPSS